MKVKTLLPQRCALRKCHVIGGQNTRDQIAFYAFHSFVVWSPRGWLHRYRACAIATWILGFWAPLAVRNSDVYALFKPFSHGSFEVIVDKENPEKDRWIFQSLPLFLPFKHREFAHFTKQLLKKYRSLSIPHQQWSDPDSCRPNWIWQPLWAWYRL